MVLPPPYWEQPPTKPVRLRFFTPTRGASAQATICSAGGGLFRVSSSSGSPSRWSVTLPSFAAWQGSISNGSLQQEFDRFLDDLGRLETEGCFPGGVGALLEQAVRESIPVLVHDTLYYRYDWQPAEGFVNLEPGMRLKIERADHGPSGKIQGTSITYYRVTRDAHRMIAFRLTGDKTKSAAAEDQQDGDLAATVHDTFYVRLFLSGEHVPNSLKYTALIIGTRTQERMAEIAASLQAHPDTGCPQGPYQQVDCMMFRGSVTVSAELQVTANGKPVFVGLEEGVQSLFDQPKPPCSPGSFRIERPFLSKLAPIEFGGPDGSSLMLVAGDRLACSGT